MFTSGRIIFAIVFALVFIAVLVYSYRKDIRKNPNYFKGTYKILGAVVVTFAIFYLAVKLLS